MRGRTARQVTMLTVTPDELIPTAHPMRRVKPLAEAALGPAGWRACGARKVR